LQTFLWVAFLRLVAQGVAESSDPFSLRIRVYFMIHHNLAQPSSWVRRWCREIVPTGRVLDLACGSGRHSRLLLQSGYRVLAADQDISELADLQGRSNFESMQVDLENAVWPFEPESVDGIVVTNYLFRPTLSLLLAALKPAGLLIYETFAEGNGEFGRPSNPDFLLRPGELLDVVNGAGRVIAYEDIFVDVPKPALVQRICAVKNGGSLRYFPAPSN
jgi:SAM-dependent methyltransferase